MDFRAEVQALLDQVPRNRTARVGDLARALGDVRASVAIARLVRDDPDLRGGERVVRSGGRPVRRGSTVLAAEPFTGFEASAPLARLRAEQSDIAANVSRRNRFAPLRTIGGVDVSYDGDRAFVALVVLRASDLAVVEEVLALREADFPYIPTYLAYREGPLIAAAVGRASEPPSVLLVDGHGVMHPARCGLACHVGVRLDRPTIGVAKNPLVGTLRHRPRRGGSAPVDLDGRVAGYALRTTDSVRPLFVSTGHRVHPRTAVRIVRDASVRKHPEPLRLAHVRATEWKRKQRKNVQDGLISLPSPMGRIPQSEGEH